MPDLAVSFTPCRPTEDDARQVMAWRNDPVTLSASRHREPKQWPRFWPEFRDTYFPDETALSPVFALLGEDRIGFLRFVPAPHPLSPDRRTAEISINIAPEWRGKGLGTVVLRAALDHLRGWEGDAVCAEVREENVVSIKAFVAAGFREIDVREVTIPDTGETCRMARFVFDLR